jgi:hypothetical protein
MGAWSDSIGAPTYLPAVHLYDEGVAVVAPEQAPYEDQKRVHGASSVCKGRREGVNV